MGPFLVSQVRCDKINIANEELYKLIIPTSAMIGCKAACKLQIWDTVFIVRIPKQLFTRK